MLLRGKPRGMSSFPRVAPNQQLQPTRECSPSCKYGKLRAGVTVMERKRLLRASRNYAFEPTAKCSGRLRALAHRGAAQRGC